MPFTGTAETKRLLEMLDGLPLAIAQAGAYLQESGVGLKDYLGFYEQQWSDLMESTHLAGAPLQDYPQRSVWTTWAISYQAIYNKHEHTAKLLLLWSFLDNKDLWYGIFAERFRDLTAAASMISKWIGKIASSKLAFSQAMQLLRNYSLIEAVEETASYTMHPVVHQWAYYYQGKQHVSELGQLAVFMVAWAVPARSDRDYSALQRRLLPHAQACSRWAMRDDREQSNKSVKGPTISVRRNKKQLILLDAMHLLGNLYMDQGKLAEAEQMYEQALRGREETLGPKHQSTLSTVNSLGNLYAIQGNPAGAVRMYGRAMRGVEEGALELNHPFELTLISNIGLLFASQRQPAEAEESYERALRGWEEALGPNHISTLDTVNNLGSLYLTQGKLAKAEQMYERALQGCKEALGPNHTSTLDAVGNLGILYLTQGKLAEAEQMCKRALQGKEKALGPNHISTLETVIKIGSLYLNQGKLAEAEEMYNRALRGMKDTLEPNYILALFTANDLGTVYLHQGKLVEAEHFYKVALAGREKALRSNHKSTLDTVNNLGNLYLIQGKLAEAEQMYKRALQGYEALGPNHKSIRDIVHKLGSLYLTQGKLAEAEQMYKRVRGQTEDSWEARLNEMTSMETIVTMCKHNVPWSFT
jgi:tetratricopeptide (TPR) repeat protein